MLGAKILLLLSVTSSFRFINLASICCVGPDLKQEQEQNRRRLGCSVCVALNYYYWDLEDGNLCKLPYLKFEAARWPTVT